MIFLSHKAHLRVFSNCHKSKIFPIYFLKKICNISELAQFKPVLSKGQLYIKHVGFLVCLESLLLRLPSPGDLPDPGIERGSLALQADSLLSEPPRQPINGSKGRAKNRGTGSKPFKKRAEGSRAFSSFILPAHLSRRLYLHSLERMKQGT